MSGSQDSPRRRYSLRSPRKRSRILFPLPMTTSASTRSRQAFSNMARNIIAADSELLSFHHPAKVLAEFMTGLKDSVQVLYTVSFLLISSRVREAFVKLTILNLALYNGINHAASIVFQGINYLLEASELDYKNRYQGKVIHFVHLLSILATSIWYTYLAEHSYKLHGRKVVNQNLSFMSFLRKVSQEVYRFFIFGLILLQIHLVGFFPLGIYLKFCAWCLVCGYYSFEYKWKLMDKSLVKRLAMFEDGVFYFMGFGFVLTLIATIFPNLLESGIFPALFTSNVIIAVVKEPRNLSNSRVPVFYPTNVVITVWLNCWKYMMGVRKRHPSKKNS